MWARGRGGLAQSRMLDRTSNHERPETREGLPGVAQLLPYIPTSQRKVRNTVCLGPPKCTSHLGIGLIMRIQEPIEEYGYFWLAAEPDNKLSGILSISEKGDASLEIFGAIGSPAGGSGWQLSGERLRILGVTDKAGAVTLVDCFVLQQDTVGNTGELLSKSSLHVDCVFRGVHFDTGEICFSGVTFSVEGLDEWFCLHHRPFATAGVPPEPMSITYTQPEPITFSIPDDFQIGFNMWPGMKLGMFQETITTAMNITIASSQPRSFVQLMQVLESKELSLPGLRPSCFIHLNNRFPAGTKRALGGYIWPV